MGKEKNGNIKENNNDYCEKSSDEQRRRKNLFFLKKNYMPNDMPCMLVVVFD